MVRKIILFFKYDERIFIIKEVVLKICESAFVATFKVNENIKVGFSKKKRKYATFVGENFGRKMEYPVVTRFSSHTNKIN